MFFYDVISSVLKPIQDLRNRRGSNRRGCRIPPPIRGPDKAHIIKSDGILVRCIFEVLQFWSTVTLPSTAFYAERF
jgi:hypothetical protein